jgi:hypothetical protein
MFWESGKILYALPKECPFLISSADQTHIKHTSNTHETHTEGVFVLGLMFDLTE